MTRYEFAPNARREFYSILDYIADRSPAGARRVRNAVHDAVEKLGERPGLGHKGDDLTSRPVRFFTVMRRYTIIYRGEEPPIEVIHVVGPGRDIASLLR
jgi:plasmid stabilization system protein ParE